MHRQGLAKLTMVVEEVVVWRNSKFKVQSSKFKVQNFKVSSFWFLVQVSESQSLKPQPTGYWLQATDSVPAASPSSKSWWWCLS